MDTSQLRPPGKAAIVVSGYQPKAPTGSAWSRNQQIPQNQSLPTDGIEDITGRTPFNHWLA
jgi:hypothetical protein